MKICPKCHTLHADAAERCSVDGARLAVIIQEEPPENPADGMTRRQQHRSLARSLQAAPPRRCRCGKPMLAIGAEGRFTAFIPQGRELNYACVVCGHRVSISSPGNILWMFAGVLLFVAILYGRSGPDGRSGRPGENGLGATLFFWGMPILFFILGWVSLQQRAKYRPITPVGETTDSSPES